MYNLNTLGLSFVTSFKSIVADNCYTLISVPVLLLISLQLESSSMAPFFIAFIFKPLTSLLYIHAVAHNFPWGPAQHQPFILLLVDWSSWRVKCLAQGHAQRE